MDRKQKNILLLAGVVIATIIISWQFVRPSSSRYSYFVDQPVPDGLVEFMHPYELRGDFYLVLVDHGHRECIKRHNEIHNATVKKQKSGLKGRLILACDSSLPFARSKYDADSPGKHSIGAAYSTVYKNRSIKNVPKPAAFLISDGQVIDMLIDKEFDDWLLKNQDDWYEDKIQM